MNVFVVYHLMQHYIIYRQLMHTVNLIIWCYCIQRQCLVLATFTSIGLVMCSLLWIVAGNWKMSSAIQSIWICEIVQGFTIPWDRSGLGYSVKEIFYDELVGYKLSVPRWLALQMPRDTIDELRKALNHIKEELSYHFHFNCEKPTKRSKESSRGLCLRLDVYVCA